jgi:hypothetical protein
VSLSAFCGVQFKFGTPNTRFNCECCIVVCRIGTFAIVVHRAVWQFAVSRERRLCFVIPHHPSPSGFWLLVVGWLWIYAFTFEWNWKLIVKTKIKIKGRARIWRITHK